MSPQTRRDEFDLRQGYVEFHYQPAELFVGRKELRFGQERLIGISNFTNTSRTFDGFFGRIGDKNRLDLFSTSVVVIHPTSLDTHGAGLTFHGAYATLDKLVPKMSIEPYVVIHALPRGGEPAWCVWHGDEGDAGNRGSGWAAP